MQEKIQTRTPLTPAPAATPARTELRQQPFIEPTVQTTVGQSFTPPTFSGANSPPELPPDLQTQIDRTTRFGHNFGRVQVFASQPAVIQPKLVVGQPGDQYEQEADQVAQQVMQMPAPAIAKSIQRQDGQEQIYPKLIHPLVTAMVQRQTQPAELSSPKTPHPLLKATIQRREEEFSKWVQPQRALQRSAESAGNMEASSDIESQLSQSQGRGSPLPAQVRSFMEPRFGFDFSKVRIHNDSKAVQLNRQLGAQAFTHGQDIYFSAGKSADISELTAHELTHVVQQTGGQRRVSRQTVEQNSKDLDELYKAAAVADVELRSATTEIAKQTQGTAKFPSSLKGRERATQKIMTEYSGDASKLVDIARSTIEYDSLDNLYKGLEMVKQRYEIARIKNRFETPDASGYRDMLLNIKVSNGHITEMQLHLSQINQVKAGRGHKIYEQVRSIKAQAMTEKRALTKEEEAVLDELNKESRELYDAALASSQSKVS